MTYRKLYESATRKLEKGEITLGEYEEMTKPLNEDVRTWIPVSERLPEDRTYTLVTIGIPGRQPHARSGWYQNGYIHNDNGDVWKATDIEVKAWMPLPKPYKAESEEA